jgi:hypothetical protein
MKQVAIILIFFICACSNEKKHEIDDSFFSFWIKGIIADSVIQETGSLLAEPFSKRANNLPDIIYLSPHKTNSGSRHNIVHSIFDIKDSLHEVQISNKEISALEEMNHLSRDSSVFANSSKNVLGTIWINQILSNKSNTIIYIDHSYSGKYPRYFFSAISELHFNNGRWKLVVTEVYEMT